LISVQGAQLELVADLGHNYIIDPNSNHGPLFIPPTSQWAQAGESLGSAGPDSESQGLTGPGPLTNYQRRGRLRINSS